MMEYYDHLINRYRHRFLETRLVDLDLKNPDAFFLARISKTGKVKLAHMIADVPFHKSHVTRAVMRLEELGHVKRTPDPEDLRGYVVEITESGMGIAKKVLTVIKEWDDLMLKALTKDERQTMDQLNRKICKYLSEYFEEDLPDGKNA
ncbi:MAG: MarR family transcriptional regulator [Bacilli bacterium]|nr:MarR family transcriptional regulator [Bacilli bacterium]MBN2696920.1 MarR family transcriptional regulator [Bacilli bacterium]